MIRSLYSGIGGMNNFQTKLDVIGNNIANVNTQGFKKGRVTFNDLVSQQLQGASTATDARGGTNPQQVGLGGGLSSIDTITTQGSPQTTGRDLDIAIQGDGYFVVSEGDANYYTRAGNFYLDEDGALVNADGMRVQGYTPDDIEGGGDLDGSNLNDLVIPAGASLSDIADLPGYGAIGGDVDDPDEVYLESFNISSSGEINGTFSDGETRIMGQLSMANFANPGGLNKAGGNLYEVTNNSGEPDIGLSGTGGRGEMYGSTLEMSNVDLSEEFAEMIVAQRGFQANTRMITTSDEILQELVNLKR